MAEAKELSIDGHHLSIADVVEIAHHPHLIKLSQEAEERVRAASQWIASIVEEQKPVYGINTGFGIFADKPISPEDIAALNRNLILSHAVATGPNLEAEIVRAAMLIRANTLAEAADRVVEAWRQDRAAQKTEA